MPVGWPPSRHLLEHGVDAPAPRARRLVVGPLAFTLAGVDIQQVRWGPLELVDRVYMSVRDRNWDTIAPMISGLRIRRGGIDPLVVTFDGHNRAEALDVVWKGTIRVTADGRIVYAMAGEAQADFTYCRIGFCVLHSDAAVAGRPFTAETPGGQVSGVLSRLVAPQTIVEGREVPLFPACSAVSIDLDGVITRVGFDGSLFVMEDQRNWTDASFKTCCTVGTPYPYQARRGQRFAQRVTISVSGPPPGSLVRPSGVRRVELGGQRPGGWPTLGLGMSTQLDRPLAGREISRLRTLRLDHLRVDLRLSAPDWRTVLTRAAADARAMGTRLEIALFAAPSHLDQVDDLVRLIEPSTVARVLVFDEGTAANASTPVELFESVRRQVARTLGSCALLGGTDGDFAELNRDRPAAGAFDGLTYAMNPQVHAFDDELLAETLTAQATTVATARSFAGDRPVIISPVTLRQRFNPSATDAPAPVLAGRLPPAVDPRQMSLFLAGWTLGSIATLADAGAASITYFETVGWRGVMDAARGTAAPPPFPSHLGIVFPVFHLLADLADRRGTRVIPAASSAPREVVALAMGGHGSTRLLLGNVSAHAIDVAVGPLPGATAEARLLDARSAVEAMTAPARFRRRREGLRLQRGRVTVHLPPYAYLRVDAAAG